MAPRRRPRGTLLDPVSMGYEVERASKAKLDAVAERAGVSSAVLFERMVEHLELTDQGLPVWWPEELSRDGELPIDSA